MNSLELIPQGVIIFYIFIVGLCIGSFLNVVILRGLKGEDIAFGRSHCPKCLNQLKWYMNIPLFSYLFLRGKCGFCKEKISIQYPIIEFITGILFLLIYFKFGLTFEALFYVIILCLGIVITICDILEKVIVDMHAYLMAAIGLIYSFLPISNVDWMSSLIGLIIGFLILEIISKILEKSLGQRPFGEGDSLILMGLGACFGYKSLACILPFSMIIQTIATVPLMVFNSFKQKKFMLGISYFIILLAMSAVACFNLIDELKNGVFYNIATFSSVALLLFALIQVLKDLKQKREEFENLDNLDDVYDEQNPYLLLPFGPALVVSGLIYMFFGQNIKTLILNFIFN